MVNSFGVLMFVYEFFSESEHYWYRCFCSVVKIYYFGQHSIVNILQVRFLVYQNLEPFDNVKSKI